LVQPPVKSVHIESIGQLLSLGEVLDLDKNILHKRAGYLFLGEPGGQLVVSIEVELQPEGSPGRHSQITQPQLFQDEIEIVMNTLGFGASKRGLPCLLVMPGLERRTGLQGREDMDQPRMFSSLGENLLDPFFFTKILFPDELNLQTILLGQTLCLETDFIPQGLGKSRIVKEPNPLGPQMATHGLAVANLRNRSCNDHTIKARKYPSNLTGIFFGQQSHGFPLREVSKGYSMLIDERDKKVNPGFDFKSHPHFCPLLLGDKNAGKCVATKVS